MSIEAGATAGARTAFRASDRALMTIYTGSIALSALLLFAIQPMFTKLALPLLGGAANVWNTAMVFFQATLLGGYLYAHVLTTRAPLRLQVLIHLLVMSVGFLFLPIGLAWADAPTDGAPAAWLMALFAASLGAPFFALSANAPLFQRWFANTDHRDAKDPYFLYAASNVGSLVALGAYPVLVEPSLGLADQSVLWTVGYLALFACIAVAGLAVVSRAGAVADAARDAVASVVRTGWSTRARWTLLAAAPASLMLGVTSHLSVNVSSAPFLWVGPLSLYLLTFIISFANGGARLKRALNAATPAAIPAGLALIVFSPPTFLLMAATHFAVFFLVAQGCHARLAESRPEAARLTEFYLFVSLGGVLGGAFTALVAPLAFNDVHEYPLVLAASAFALVVARPTRRDVVGFAGLFAAICVGMLAAPYVVSLVYKNGEVLAVIFAMCFAGVAAFAQRDHGYRFAGACAGFAAALALMGVVLGGGASQVVFKERNFFGVSTVVEHDSEHGRKRLFLHGDTVHNAQFVEPELRRQPLVYFAAEGPYGQVVRGVRARRGGPIDVGVVGLGAGALACFAEGGETWTYYEIDPAVVRMALDPEIFTFMSDCQPGAPVKVGDARLTLAAETDKRYDLLILDAFSSDSIPAHLITREAIQLYLQRIKPDGVIYFHTSNRFADVTSVALATARDVGLDARANYFRPSEDGPFADHKAAVSAVVAGDAAVLDEALVADADQWRRLEPHPAVDVWTDDYSHIVSALIAHKPSSEIE
ncbi:MAG: fused MFS/spermidine synthase [Parvularculaceae bacterium]